jgi:hypothetical protein
VLSYTVMLRTIHKICTILIIALGLLHVLFTAHDYSEFSLRAVWFLGTGVAIILAGFLNVVLMRDVGKDRLVQWLCHISNIIFTVLFAYIGLNLLPQPQVFVGTILFAITTLSAFLVDR